MLKKNQTGDNIWHTVDTYQQLLKFLFSLDYIHVVPLWNLLQISHCTDFKKYIYKTNAFNKVIDSRKKSINFSKIAGESCQILLHEYLLKANDCNEYICQNGIRIRIRISTCTIIS